jgi:hypothetical protein
MFNLKKSIVFFAALLGLLSVGIASANGGGKEKAKTYGISVHSATKVGTVVLKPGDYKIKVEGANAIFSKEDSNTSFTTPGKIETVSDHFAQTILHQVQDGDQSRIVSIELKGTQSLLKFD